MAQVPKKLPKKAAKKETGRNMGLGKLKGAMNGRDRKSRIEAAIDEDTGYKPKKK